MGTLIFHNLHALGFDGDTLVFDFVTHDIDTLIERKNGNTRVIKRQAFLIEIMTLRIING